MNGISIQYIKSNNINWKMIVMYIKVIVGYVTLHQIMRVSVVTIQTEAYITHEVHISKHRYKHNTTY